MKQILVIDDDDDFRSYLKEALTRAGYEITEAANGAIGSKIFMQQSFDLVITDIFMPEKEGLETILELKTKSPEIKFIAISGGGLGGTDPNLVLGIAKEMGADKILNKPISIKNLLEAISETLLAE